MSLRRERYYSKNLKSQIFFIKFFKKIIFIFLHTYMIYIIHFSDGHKHFSDAIKEYEKRL